MARQKRSDLLRASLADVLDGRVSLPDVETVASHTRDILESTVETPPKTQGACRVCGGNLVERFHQSGSIMDARIGGPPPPRTHNGYHCGRCGIMYAFIPPESEQENP